MIRTIVFAVVITCAATAAHAGYTRKLCHGQTWRGQTVDFVCSINETCCFDKVLRKGVCAKDTGRRAWARCLFAMPR